MATQASCTACGESNPSDAAFCLTCGVYLGWDARGDPPTSAPSPSGSPPTSGLPSTSGPPPAAVAPVVGQSRSEAPAAPPPAPAPDVVSQALNSAGPSCPSCGKPVTPDLRFCSRCGQLLITPAATPVRPSPGPALRREQRDALRAYRRSLPPSYRWRRVGVSLVAVLLAAALAWFLAGDPVGTVKGWWHDLRDHEVPVNDVTAVAAPEGSAASDRSPGNVLDGRAGTSWATSWDPAAPPDGACGHRGGGVRLSWEGPAELTTLRVRAGLDPGTQRTREFVPRVLGIPQAGDCTLLTLKNDDGWQRATLDLSDEVDEITLVVVDTYPQETDPPENTVSIRDLALLARPR